MANIIVSGLPSSARMPKAIHIFKPVLKSCGVKHFWIQSISEIHGSDLKQAILELLTPDDAFKVQETLDNYLYKSNGQVYPFSVRIDSFINQQSSRPSRRRSSPRRFNERHYERSPSPYEYGHRSRDHERDYHGSYSRGYSPEVERSRSPLYGNEASQLDLEIEMLRKKRQIIEEERRLLLERKKLDLVKEYGTSAVKEFRHLDKPRERRRRPEREPFQQKSKYVAQPPPASRPIAKPKLPGFVLPCKFLMAEMKDVINQNATKEEKKLLIKLTRTNLKKRIAVALEDKGYMKTDKILKLYRSLYPASQDEAFVQRLTNQIRQSLWPAKSKKPETEKNKTESEQNKKDTADDKNVKEDKEGASETEQKHVEVQKDGDNQEKKNDSVSNVEGVEQKKEEENAQKKDGGDAQKKEDGDAQKKEEKDVQSKKGEAAQKEEKDEQKKQEVTVKDQEKNAAVDAGAPASDGNVKESNEPSKAPEKPVEASAQGREDVAKAPEKSDEAEKDSTKNSSTDAALLAEDIDVAMDDAAIEDWIQDGTDWDDDGGEAPLEL